MKNNTSLHIKKWLFIGILLLSINLYSQTKNPQKWMFGAQPISMSDTSEPDTGYYLRGGANILDFTNNPFTISRYARNLSLSNLNIGIYDNYNNLIFYSNGNKVFNGFHRLIEGADSLNFDIDWNSPPYENSYFGEYYINLFPESMLAFQSITNPNQYYLIASNINKEEYTFPKLTYSLLDMSLNDGRGKMIQKESVIKKGGFAETISACRHSNGKDWWIFSKEYESNCYTKLKLNAEGIKEFQPKQCIGWEFKKTTISNSEIKSSKFSWNGKYYAVLSIKGLEVFDFDRCTGELYNRRETKLPDTIWQMALNGLCFSPNSQLIYITTSTVLFQYNIFNKELLKVVDYDGFEDTIAVGGSALETYFAYPQLAPNGRIYISTGNGTRYLHEIEHPDSIGIACHVKQHAVNFLVYNGGLPNFPNYELGADTCTRGALSNLNIDDFYLYPNPASEFLLIETRSLSDFTFEIHNLLGKKYSEGAITNKIDVSSLSEGIYFLTLVTNETRIVKKFEVRR